LIKIKQKRIFHRFYYSFSQKGVDDTVDLMEELLKSTQKTQKKPSTPEPVKNPARTRPAERRQSVVRKQSDDELINELLNKQERSKSKISNFEMNELFGISEKPRKDISSNLVDDLDQILSTRFVTFKPTTGYIISITGPLVIFCHFFI
jgi:flagellar biosynthesis GTPase FlhF